MKKLKEKEDCRPYIRMVCVFIIEPIAVFAFYAASALRVYMLISFRMKNRVNALIQAPLKENLFILLHKYQNTSRKKNKERGLWRHFFFQKEKLERCIFFTKKAFQLSKLRNNNGSTQWTWIKLRAKSWVTSHCSTQRKG